ncbi:hypothetical protein RSAG8_12849, partial [Rhizoctonia solani AG-8 WAC10335]
MADSIAPHACTWPERLQVVEIRAHEIAVGPVARLEPSIHRVINALLHTVFKCELPNPHVVRPQGPLRAPPPERPRSPIPIAPELDHSLDSNMEDSEPSSAGSLDQYDIPDNLLASLVGDFDDYPFPDNLDNQSNAASFGDDSSADGDSIFPLPSPGEVSTTNFHTPATGRGQGRIKKGDLKIPDFLVYKANPNGCFSEGGGPDILRLVVAIKSGEDEPAPVVRLSLEDRLRLQEYFIRVRAMNAVGVGVMLIVKGDVYFWHHDELWGESINVPIQLDGRYSRRIDSWGLIEFLQRWKEEEVGVSFDVPLV